MKSEHDIIKSFVVSTFLVGSPGVEIDDETSFLDTGLIDSMRILELVEFLEGRFGVTVTDSELIPENLDSIGRICT